MAKQIADKIYLSLSDVAKTLDVARQTVWRWYKSGKLPPGVLYRDGRTVLFSPADVEKIREYAQHVEPIFLVADAESPDQLVLFNGTRRGGRG